MTPTTILNAELEVIEGLPPTLTYEINSNNLGKQIDGLAALKQAIYKVLNTEKYQYPIYSFNYGIELESLINKDINYVKIELRRRIEECLLLDSRIEAVDDFEFILDVDSLTCNFKVISIYGDLSLSKEVSV